MQTVAKNLLRLIVPIGIPISLAKFDILRGLSFSHQYLILQIGLLLIIGAFIIWLIKLNYKKGNLVSRINILGISISFSKEQKGTSKSQKAVKPPPESE